MTPKPLPPLISLASRVSFASIHLRPAEKIGGTEPAWQSFLAHASDADKAIARVRLATLLAVCKDGRAEMAAEILELAERMHFPRIRIRDDHWAPAMHADSIHLMLPERDLSSWRQFVARADLGDLHECRERLRVRWSRVDQTNGYPRDYFDIDVINRHERCSDPGNGDEDYTRPEEFDPPAPRETLEVDPPERPSEEKLSMAIDWIDHNIEPTADWGTESSYGLKHRLEADTDLYLSNHEFKFAMRECGYEPQDPSVRNWIYRAALIVVNA